MDNSLEKYILSQEEEIKIKECWDNNVTKIKDIIVYVFGAGFDGRSKEGIAVKDFLGNMANISSENAVNSAALSKPIKETKVSKVELTEEDKKFINDNIAAINPIRPIELAKIIFKNPDIEPLSAEYRVLKSYIDTIVAKERKKYTPPKTLEQVIARTNKYLSTELDWKTLTIRQKECAQCALKYTSVYRFISEMDILKTPDDRELFESQFFRYVYDKTDLTSEDIDLYIDVCKGQIQEKYLTIEYDNLSAIKDEMLEQGTFPKTLYEEVSEIRKDLNSIRTKNQSTLQSLNKKRSDRIDNLSKSFGSVLNLVEAMRAKETRDKWIALAKLEEGKKENEVKRLDGLSELIFETFGIGKKEI